MHAMLGKTEPDWMGTIFRTGFYRFKAHCGVGGLAKEPIAQALEVLAIHATKPGTGQLRKFVKLAKKNYRVVTFLHIMNPELRDVLLRYGFSDYGSGDYEGMRWIEVAS